MRRFLFEEGNDREYILDFMGSSEAHAWGQLIDRLLSTERGKRLYDRHVACVESCYSACALERTVETRYMCTPHALLTGLYDFEARYIDVG